MKLKKLIIFLTIVLSITIGGYSIISNKASNLPFSKNCGALVNKKIANALITDVEFPLTSGPSFESCSVYGEINSSPTSIIKFNVILPAPTAWNHKIVQLGGSGYNGIIGGNIFIENSKNDFLKRGYATAQSDSGHQGKNLLDLSFALNNPNGFDNFAFASAPQVLIATEALIYSIYGSFPKYKYFYGSSNGGREALQQAQRYPKNYNGIIALQPIIDYSLINQKSLLIQQKIADDDWKGWLSPQKTKAFEMALLAACDHLDNLTDGIIANVEACRFNPETLLCSETKRTNNDCLTERQLATVRLLTNDTSLPVSPLSNNLHTSWKAGLGDEGLGWMGGQMGFPPNSISSTSGILAEEWIKFAVTSNPDVDILNYDPIPDVKIWKALSEKNNASNADLTTFSKNGGKLILSHGWSDQLVQPWGSVDLYLRVIQSIGQDSTDSFMRLYMLPGVNHENAGAGANHIDYLSLLENWVEKNIAPPNPVIASKLSDKGDVLFTRPVCHYPKWPRYNGIGDHRDAENFNCIE